MRGSVYSHEFTHIFVLQQMMEESSSQRLGWDGDAKAMQQCLTDIFTSVFTTCDIPENAIFGPCVLSHTSLYDSIAFIALKSTDKRTAPYIFRVWSRFISFPTSREFEMCSLFISAI